MLNLLEKFETQSLENLNFTAVERRKEKIIQRGLVHMINQIRSEKIQKKVEEVKLNLLKIIFKRLSVLLMH